MMLADPETLVDVDHPTVGAQVLSDLAVTPERGVHLAALVVTYNRLPQIQQTLDRLLNSPCDRVYVIDNGSTDGTREWLTEIEDPRLQVILAPRNMGGAGGFELGLRMVIERDDPDWVVLMDDDARPAPGCIETFLAQDTEGWDAISAAVYLTDGGICEMNRPTINPFWNLPTFMKTCMGTLVGQSRRGFHIPDEAYDGEAMEIDATSFVGLFLPRATIKRAGYPDGRMFIYMDDVLYTLGLRKAGMKIGFLPSLQFEHDFDRGSNGKTGLYAPIWKAYYNARNGLVVYRFAAGILFWPVLLLILAKWIAAGRHYGSDRGTYYRLVWHGIFDGLSGRFGRPHSEVQALCAP